MSKNRSRWKDNVLLKGDGEVNIKTYIVQPIWEMYGSAMVELVERHKWCFPNFVPRPKNATQPTPQKSVDAEIRETDHWGCEWLRVTNWEVGQIISHPLADPDAFADYVPPDPEKLMEHGREKSWSDMAKQILDCHEADKWYTGEWGLRIFERVHFLMGMENMMIALMEEDPVVFKIIGMAMQYNLTQINKILENRGPGLDMLWFSDDLGDQRSLLINPTTWRKYFKSCYRAMFSTCRMGGVLAGLHSDGVNSEIFDDLLEIGLDLINCQVSLIGIEKVAESLRGKICISADMDRQHIIPSGSPADVKDLVKEVVTKLGSPTGGLELLIDIYPDVPFENIVAFLEAAEEHRNYWVGR